MYIYMGQSVLSNIGCIKYVSFNVVSTLGRLSIKFPEGLCVYVSFKLGRVV